ncbi:MAG: YHS domain protein [Cyclobacteriaceae bacterium]|nr:YHS domain protein [Cyclobacteriaceae bacterium]
MKILITFFSLTLFTSAVAQQPENADRRRNFNTENYVAMREWDPVSYFQNKPARGNSKFSFEHKAITYYFVNEANLEEFKKAPSKYEPAYGGWCAYTIALNGERVKINPTTYKIVDGKLYLFYSFNNDNRLLKWNKDEAKLKASADRLWRAKMH